MAMYWQTFKGVSTHSRLKAAGSCSKSASNSSIGFNTQPPEGGWFRSHCPQNLHFLVSTHSRLKAAGK